MSVYEYVLQIRIIQNIALWFRHRKNRMPLNFEFEFEFEFVFNLLSVCLFRMSSGLQDVYGL
jgi:hypothetical protein